MIEEKYFENSIELGKSIIQAYMISNATFNDISMLDNKIKNMKSKRFKTPSNTSPKSTKRGCLCADGKKYSNKCCDGSFFCFENVTF